MSHEAAAARLQFNEWKSASGEALHLHAATYGFISLLRSTLLLVEAAG